MAGWQKVFIIDLAQRAGPNGWLFVGVWSPLDIGRVHHRRSCHVGIISDLKIGNNIIFQVQNCISQHKMIEVRKHFNINEGKGWDRWKWIWWTQYGLRWKCVTYNSCNGNPFRCFTSQQWTIMANKILYLMVFLHFVCLDKISYIWICWSTFWKVISRFLFQAHSFSFQNYSIGKAKIQKDVQTSKWEHYSNT